jgi:hypothetical protein
MMRSEVETRGLHVLMGMGNRECQGERGIIGSKMEIRYY